MLIKLKSGQYVETNNVLSYKVIDEEHIEFKYSMTKKGHGDEECYMTITMRATEDELD